MITNLKLRATYGFVGNDAMGRPRTGSSTSSEVNMNDINKNVSFGINPTGMYTRPGISVLRYANPNITREVAHQTNLGMDMTLWNKLNVVLDVYSTRRTNILMSRVSIPTTVGLAATPSANIGAASSRGIDLSLDYSHTINKACGYRPWQLHARHE